MRTIHVLKWTDAPGGRFREEGKYSAEEFRDDILVPVLRKSIETKELVNIDMDGTYGYANCWLEEVFGGLVPHYIDYKVLIRKINAIICHDDTKIPDIAFNFMMDAINIKNPNFEVTYVSGSGKTGKNIILL